ncbi:hypothetical protein O4H66_17150 [Comamonadaceae bacterium G21597-S1]|nr:hypothetical protein [Comamonadaceae bacterium G21597-S1]
MLTFDEATHTYRYSGQVVPSVTQILRPMMDLDHVDPDLLRRASAFGIAVHAACELDDRMELDESALDPALRPYLMAWRKFCREHGCSWELIESRVYHPSLRYAGTLDRHGFCDGYRSIVDIKSGTALYPSVGPQLSAYAHAHAQEIGQPSMAGVYRRYAVRLFDGGYELKQYTDPTDFSAFASLVTLRQFAAKHRITIKEISHA